MKIKRIIASFSAIGMIFAFTACQKDDKNIIDDETNKNNISSDVTFADTVSDTTSAETTKANETTTLSSNTETTTAKINENDPSQWSKDKIVQYYIKACANSATTVKSQQLMSLSDISINDGEGVINGMFKMIKPIITKVLENNCTEFDGITGGNQNILVSDIKSAKAYSKGDNTIVEMTMYEQVDGAKSDRFSGTVGHAISVVGDISEVLGQLSDSGLPVDIADENVTLTYTNPTFKATVGKDGVIKDGTWSYLVDINLKNFKVAGVSVDNASAVIEYTITVNGGFSSN